MSEFEMLSVNDLRDTPHVSTVIEIFAKRFPYFKSAIPRQFASFGPQWLEAFEKELAIFFKNDAVGMQTATEGYGRFALDGMRLQRIFDKTLQYENKTYAEADQEVYQNREYMFSLYLPGILLSHYLWRHHYQQQLFYRDKFLNRVLNHGGKLFYDVGVGTGFYSKEMLKDVPGIKGEGFDLSPFALEHTMKLLTKWDLEKRYSPNLCNIITEPIKRPAPFIINIEVLEHLEDPQSFIDALFRMLEPGGFGLISAAITAPNADHIYLYNNAREVIQQLESAGFILLEYVEDPAYEPRKQTDSVPRNGAFIVTRK